MILGRRPLVLIFKVHNPFLHDCCEVEEKKSPIFSLPLHNNRVKRGYPSHEKFGMTHKLLKEGIMVMYLMNRGGKWTEGHKWLGYARD